MACNLVFEDSSLPKLFHNSCIKTKCWQVSQLGARRRHRQQRWHQIKEKRNIYLILLERRLKMKTLRPLGFWKIQKFKIHHVRFWNFVWKYFASVTGWSGPSLAQVVAKLAQGAILTGFSNLMFGFHWPIDIPQLNTE